MENFTMCISEKNIQDLSPIDYRYFFLQTIVAGELRVTVLIIGVSVS